MGSQGPRVSQRGQTGIRGYKGHSGHNKGMLQSNLKSETSFVPPPGACQFQLLVFEYLYLYLYLCNCILGNETPPVPHQTL